MDRQIGDCGGLAIVVNKRGKHEHLPSFGTKVVETVAVSVDTPTGRITIASAYFPGYNLSTQTLNAKHRLWNNSRGNAAGRIIFDELNQKSFIVHNSALLTYYPPQAGRSPSNIDIVLANSLLPPS